MSGNDPTEDFSFKMVTNFEKSAKTLNKKLAEKLPSSAAEIW
jgi:hypothetical protein